MAEKGLLHDGVNAIAIINPGVDPSATAAVLSCDAGRHVVLAFIDDDDIDDGDTISLGTEGGIIRAAWEAVDDSDLVAAAVDSDRLGVTIASTGDSHNGYLHLWLAT